MPILQDPEVGLESFRQVHCLRFSLMQVDPLFYRELNEFKQQEEEEAPTDYYYFSLMQVDSFFYREPDEAEQQEEEEAPATDPEDN